ncbi:MAG: 3-oxoacyl-[acyl-carrier-protein] reductase [Ignavibacteriales bacterium]|nr:3-oxoacyl-[acyl-carrier-protein] reductase [Ignavibacteriales bacterium]
MSENKIVVISGGTRGIGRAILTAFSDKNNLGFQTDIAFIYNSSEAIAKQIEDHYMNFGISVIGYKVNISSTEDSQKVIDEIVNKFGRIDFLINNAGITKDNLLLRMSEKDFDDVININLKSVFNLTKAAFKPMMKQKFGRIVNISSIVGLIGNAGQANYAASKAGIIGFTKSTAKEFASRNINVNAVTPGFIETEMTAELNEKQRETLLQNIPLKRMGKGEDVANLVKFLCSDKADYITGQVISVDGGMVM